MGDGAERAQRPGRHPAERGLVPENAGEAGRNADRAAPVGADGKRAHAGGQRCRSAARRASRRLGGIPGIARDAGEGESVTPFQPNSGVVVLPMRIAPASRSRATTGASSVHAWSGSTVLEPRKVGQPLVSKMSLMVVGTPSSGPSGSCLRQRASESRAAASAASASTRQNALSLPSTSSMRSSTARVASTGENLPAVTLQPEPSGCAPVRQR
jgi:hypothetical protein